MMRNLPAFLVFLVFSATSLEAQVVSQPQPGDSTGTRTVQILNADRYGYRRVDSVTEIQTMAGHVQLKQDSTLFYCDSAVYNRSRKIMEAFGHVHINDRDSVHTYSDYLYYDVENKLASLRDHVRLTNGETTLYTDSLHYDVNQKIGEYSTGGKIVNDSTVLTSQEATYYTDLKDVYFRKNVQLNSPGLDLHTDTLLYNTNSRVATFVALTKIRDSSNRRITTREGFYNMLNKQAYFGKRSVIDDGPVRIVADVIQTNDSTGVNKLLGNAVYKDTAQGIAILANSIEAYRKEGNFLATQHPLMIIRQDKDSLYLTADTLYSGRLSTLHADSLRQQAAKDSLSAAVVRDSVQADSSRGLQTVHITRRSDTLQAPLNDSTDRYFKAWYHVRIYSDSMQAVADSLYYSGLDSVFRLYHDPILWASGNQVTGDTVYLYTKNKQADHLYVADHGMAVNKAGDQLFNQVSGNRLYGFFKEGVIDHLQAKGSAQSIYYVKDDRNKMVGVNKASGDVIEMRFVNRELNRVLFINAVAGTLYPVHALQGDEGILRGFHWYEDRRPKTKFELFGD